MDELALLKDFRLEDAVPNGAREHARRVLRAAIARRRSRRRVTFVLGFVGAAVLAGAAYGIARELVVGGPAPPEVKEHLARFGHEADLIPHPHPGDPIVDEARVAAVLDSSAGRAYLFSVPSDTALCGWIWIEGDRGYQGRPDMASVCGSPERTFWAQGRQDVRDRPVWLFWGRVREAVSRVELRFNAGTVDLPLTDRWFFLEIADEGPTAVIAYDRAGDVIADEFRFRELPERPPVRLVPRPNPQQVGPARELLSVDARGGTERITLEVARSSDGGSCRIVRSDRTRPNRFCGRPVPEPREIAVSPIQFGGAPTGVQLLVGQVGTEIVRLRLRYQDGRLEDVPLREGWALYEVVREDYAEGRRPSLMIGLDSSGREVAAKRLPWA